MKVQGRHLIAGGVAAVLVLLGLDYGGFTAPATAAVAISVWWVIALGLALGLVPRAWIPRTAVVAGILLVVLAALTTTSIGWAFDRGLAFAEAVQIAMIAGAFLLSILLSKRGEGRSWMRGVGFGLFGIILLALVSRFFPELGDDRELTASLGEIVGGRLSWPLGYWNAIGAVAALYAVLAVFFGGSGSSRLWRALSTASLPATLTVFYLCSSRGALVAALIGIVLLVALGPGRTRKVTTLLIGFLGGIPPIFVASRSYDLVHAQPTPQADEQGLVLLAVTLAATAVCFGAAYLLDKRLQRSSIPRTIGWSLTATVIALVVASAVIADPVERFETFTEAPTETPGISDNSAYATEHLLGGGGNGRWQLWSSAFRAAESEPLGGVGAGGFATWFKQDGDIWFKTIDAHSTPLQVLAELGIPGFLLFALFGLIVGIAGVRRFRDGPYTEKMGEALNEEAEGSEPDWSELGVWLSLLLAGLVAISIDWSLEFPVVSISLMITAAMLCGPAYRVEPTPERESRGGSLLYTAILVPLAAVAITMAWKQHDASTSIEASQKAFSDGRPEEALKKALAAIDAEPWAGEPYSQAAAVFQSDGRPLAALRYARMATQESPQETSFWIQRATIEARVGLEGPALRSLQRAEATDPAAPIWSRASLPAQKP